MGDMYSAGIEDFLFGLCSMTTDSAIELADMLLGLSSYGSPGKGMQRLELVRSSESSGTIHSILIG